MSERIPNPEFDIEAELARMQDEAKSSESSAASASNDEGVSSFKTELRSDEMDVIPTQVEFTDRWANRRKMAWIAFFSIIIAALLCMFLIDTERLKALEPVITWFFGAMTSIVGAYMGFATMVDLKKK